MKEFDLTRHNLSQLISTFLEDINKLGYSLDVKVSAHLSKAVPHLLNAKTQIIIEDIKKQIENNRHSTARH